MKNKEEIQIFFYFLFLITLSNQSSSFEQVKNDSRGELVLIEPRKGEKEPQLKLKWNYDEREITFELNMINQPAESLSESFKQKHPGVESSQVNWLIFGIKNHNINSDLKADLIVSWLKPIGEGHFSDRALFSSSNGRAVRDHDNITNVFLLDAYKKNDKTIIKYKRFIDTCSDESLGDIDIKEGEVELLYQVGNLYENGDYFVESDDLMSSLISKRVQLMKPSNRKTICPQIESDEFKSTPEEKYLYSEELLPSTYKFFWNFTDTDLIGEIHVKTRGWVSFGLSQTGKMDKSDVIVAWINDNDGSVHFTDRFITGRQVKIDKKQDWIFLGAKQTNEFTIIKFKRPIMLCDSDDLKKEV